VRNVVRQFFAHKFLAPLTPFLAPVTGVCLGLFLVGCSEQDLPPTAQNLPWEIELIGSDFEWEITDPGRDGKLGTHDDLHLTPPIRLPANIPVRVRLRSRDFLYTFELPEHQIKEIAVPDLSYSVEFNSGQPRETEFRGDQFCNNSHNALSGALLIQNWHEFRRWQAQAESKQAATLIADM